MQILTLDALPHEAVWNDDIRADFATWSVGQDCPVHYHEADGSTRQHNRPRPGPDARRLGRC